MQYFTFIASILHSLRTFQSTLVNEYVTIWERMKIVNDICILFRIQILSRTILDGVGMTFWHMMKRVHWKKGWYNLRNNDWLNIILILLKVLLWNVRLSLQEKVYRAISMRIVYPQIRLETTPSNYAWVNTN